MRERETLAHTHISDIWFIFRNIEDEKTVVSVTVYPHFNLFHDPHTHIYIYIYTYVCKHVYRKTLTDYIYIYIYTHICIQRVTL